MERWPEDAIADWYAAQPWLCGFNYLPRTAGNWIEQWQAESFDLVTVEQELGWAAAVGFNTLRTNLHSLIWATDAAGLRARLDRFLGVAARHGMRVMFCLFDDCGFSGIEPRLGPQGDPVPNLHNSLACASPGRARVLRRDWRGLESYVRGIVGHFRDDARILAWDLYNEPGNDSVFRSDTPAPPSNDLLAPSMALLEATFDWARAERPSQPLTTGVWNLNWSDANQRLIELSDVVSFHSYLAIEFLGSIADELARHRRPLLCTEWLARGLGSLPATHLPFFRERKIGCYHWGLVNGRTQTHLAWPGFESVAEGGLWFHDLFHPDGAPYDPAEIAAFRAALR